MLKIHYGVAADIKWANDIHVGGKKICGILAEMTETEKGPAVIVGIGINLDSYNFPPEISDSATSIEGETGKATTADWLLPSLTFQLEHFYRLLHIEDGPAAIRNEWANRSTYYFGKDVRVILPNETLIGTTCGLEDNGALRVKQPDGEIRIVQAGDVEKLRAV